MPQHLLPRTLRILGALLCAAVLLTPAARAQVGVTLAWDANPAEENVTAYILYHGTTSRSASGFTGYDASVDLGNVTQYTVTITNPEVDHFFAVVARNAAGLTSDYSVEVKRAGTSAPPPATWTVTTSASSGGSVSPDGATEVSEGSDLTVSITPAAGYGISEIVVDGSSIGTPGNYTFHAVSSDHTLAASFALLDIDGDSLPDRWEQQYFSNLSVSADGDFDGDGITNLAEYLAGTDPTVANLDASLTPVVRGPVSGGTVVQLQPEISVYNPIHGSEVALTYEFEVSHDAAMTQIVASESGVTEGTGYTFWAPPRNLANATRYYWRSRTTAETVASPWSPTCTFYVDTQGVATGVSEPTTAYVVAGTAGEIDVLDPNSTAYQVALDLPAGTLPYDFVATIQTVDNPPAATDARLLGRVYEFGPHGVPLAQKAKIWLPYTQDNLTDAGVGQPRDLNVLTYDTTSLTWEPVPIASVDYINRRLICEVEHFSMYVVGTFNASGSGGGSSPQQSSSGGGGGGGGGCFLQSLW